MRSFCRAAWRKETNRFSWCRWEDNIKIYLTEKGMGGYELDLLGKDWDQ